MTTNKKRLKMKAMLNVLLFKHHLAEYAKIKADEECPHHLKDESWRQWSEEYNADLARYKKKFLDRWCSSEN